MAEKKADLDNLYSEKFFENRNKYNWRAPIMSRVIRETFRPKTFVDVGCAIGDIVRELVCDGVDAYGIEGSASVIPYLEVPPERVLIHDLRDPIVWGKKVDCLTCFEVAEHIEEDFIDVFVRSLSSISDILIMSIECGGAKNKYHFTHRPIEWWAEKFSAESFLWDIEATANFKELIKPWGHKYGIKAFYQNLIIFKR